MARRSSSRPQAQALDEALRRFFRSLEARAVPDGLKAVLDQLQARDLERVGR